MDPHRTTGRRRLGLGLALATMLLWAMLPIALEIVLRSMDAPTIVWLRFCFAALVLGALLAWRGRLPALGGLGAPGWGLLAVATLFLAANYLAFLVGLDMTHAANAQVLIQLAPLLLALGALVVFGERFSGRQWAGFAVLALGLATFFSEQLRAVVGEADRYLVGSGFMLLASVTWAIYGLAQKQLLQLLSSQGIMVCIYAGCALLFAPFAEPASLRALDGTALAALLFCAVNTLLAYGAFSESLAHWEASRVSAVIALTPLATLAFVEIGSRLSHGLVEVHPISAASLAGAGAVVAGSLGVALGGAPVAQE